MHNMSFVKDNFKNFFNNNSLNYSFEKPAICPHCGTHQSANNQGAHKMKFGDSLLIILVLSCNVCDKRYFATYTLTDTTVIFCNTYPLPTANFDKELIRKLSPRFVEMFKQSLHAEEIGDLNLAAIGLRSALEILIKDYAIIELKEPQDKVIEKSLFTAISEYLNRSDLIKSADVVRILGNDHTHYERKYPEYDYSILKNYMNIFISQIEVELMLKNPPVSRHSQP